MLVFSKLHVALGQLLVAVLAAALSFPMPARAEGPYLTLIETVADDVKFWPGHWTVSDGAASNDVYAEGSYVSQHTWSSPPAQMDASGFTVSLQVTASMKPGCGRYYTGTAVGGVGFEYSADPAGFGVNIEPPANCDASVPGQSKSNSGSITVKPSPNLGDGSIVELKLNGYNGPTMTYRYQVSSMPPEGGSPPVGGTPVTPPDEEHLAAQLECPGSIVVSALPSLNCHIVITSWRRNTADPVEVILPDALDFYGNHANGIQLLQAAGVQDVFNWSAPYRWGMFVSACPSQSGTGANCFGSATVPGTQPAVNIIVRQGADEVLLTLVLNAMAGPGTGRASICGFGVGQVIFDRWMQTGGESGALGCATGAEQDVQSASGAMARSVPFQGGMIVLHTASNLSGATFVLQGSIGALYTGMGASASWLGLPESDESDIEGGRRSDFENGYIAWDRLTGGSIPMRDGSAAISFEPDSNRGGSDYSSFPVIGDRVEMCRDACAAETSCAAYTYVRPGLQGPRAMCWLKSVVPPAATDGCCTSGVRY